MPVSPDRMSRRDALRVLGTAAAASAALPLLEGCHPQAARGATAAPARGVVDLRGQLREVVTGLLARFPHATAQATLRSRGGAAIDSAASGAQRERTYAVVLSARDATGRRFEEVTTDVSPDGVARAAAALLARAPAERPSAALTDFGAPRDFEPTLVDDPASGEPDDWLDRLAGLHLRAQEVGNSRIVYRGVYLTVEDAEVLVVAPGVDLRQRLVRTRAGVLLVAWSGSQAYAEDVSQGGLLGLEAIAIADDAIAQGAARALSLFTPRPPALGVQAVVLDPSVAALLAHQCVGRALEADRWVSGEADAARRLGQQIGSAAVTLIDDPTAAPGYGTYWFDDEGTLAAPTTLIEAGVLKRPVTDLACAAALGLPPSGNGRRAGPVEAVSPRVSNVAFAPGDRSVEALLRGAKDGLLLEGGRAAWIDVSTWRFTLRAARARGIVGGALSGHLYANVDLHGDVPSLLAAVTAVSSDSGRFAATCAGERGEGIAVSAAGPHVLTRARVGR